MKISIDSVSDVSRDINILIPREDFDKRFQSEVSKVAQSAHIKGFRPGKAPSAHIKKLYGAKIQNELVQELVGEAYQNAISENQLNVVGRPELDVKPLDDGADLEVKATVAIYPTPEIKKWEGLKYEYSVVEFDDAVLEKELDGVKDSFTKVVAPEGREEVQDGDMVVLDYSATVDGEPFENSEAKNARLIIGRESFPKAFEKALCGMKPEETKEIKVNLPDDIANPALKGKEAVYQVTMNKVYDRQVPELTDEFIKENGISESLADLKKSIEEKAKKEVEFKNKRAQEDALLKAIIEENAFEVPEALVDEEIRSILFEARLLDPSKEESYQLKLGNFRESLGEGAEFRVRKGVVIGRLSEQLGLKAEDADVKAWLKEEAEAGGVELEVLEKALASQGESEQARFKSMVLGKKTVEKLLASNKGKSKKEKVE